MCLGYRTWHMAHGTVVAAELFGVVAEVHRERLDRNRR
jgi:hypothetical protein